MKQLIIFKQTPVDLICNLFYAARFPVIRWMFPGLLKSSSPSFKVGRTQVFADSFTTQKWGDIDHHRKRWDVSESWAQEYPIHPDNLKCWWGPPELNEDGTASFTTKYNPRIFVVDEKIREAIKKESGADPGHQITIPYESSFLSSHNYLNKLYGRFEIRCIVPNNQDVRSAFWVWLHGEIDIFEVDGGQNRQKVNFHWGREPDGKRITLGSWKINSIRPGQMQEFVMEWMPGRIVMFVDGIRVFRFSNREALDYWVSPMRVCINQNVIRETPPYKAGGVVSEFIVDYVRVYDLAK